MLEAIIKLLTAGTTRYVFLGIAVVLFVLCIVYLCTALRSASKLARFNFIVLCVDVLLFAGLTVLSFRMFPDLPPVQAQVPTSPAPTVTQAPTQTPTTEVPTEAPTLPPPEPIDLFQPHMVSDSDPANWNVQWEILQGDTVVPSYTREKSIFFGEPDTYTPLSGITTFRGNNFRNRPAWDTVTVDTGLLEKKWTVFNGTLNTWPGCGWTGQPLVTCWDDQTKQNMNLYPEKKAKDGLVEVIYATLDGYVYFIDLEDGGYTRDPAFIGMNFKGSGSLDPRGYPLLYVGSGDVYNGKSPRMYIVSLIDGSVLWSYGNNDPKALRYWSGFDGAPLVSGDTDTLIWCGENGLIYTFDLNTEYDAENGTISVSPSEPVTARYSTTRGNNTLGMENSPVIVGNYLYIADNAGLLFCVDLNTMEPVWAQDTEDDNNTTAVFEWGADGNGYLYTAPCLKLGIGSREEGSGHINLFKLDAQTGEILWKKPFDCYTMKSLPGGILSSPALGKTGTDLEGLVYFSISYHPTMAQGLFLAVDSQTGETVWSLKMDSYSWSSPIDLYTADGKGYILICSFAGTMYLLDGATGQVVSTLDLGGHVEASPIAYGNTVVIGTRSCRIYGITLQ